MIKDSNYIFKKIDLIKTKKNIKKIIVTLDHDLTNKVFIFY
mgnify:CR=1 FL=1